MLCWWAWTPCVVIPGTDQLVQEPAGSSAAVVVCVAVSAAAAVVAVECAACDGPGVGASVGVGPDVMAEIGTEQRAGEEAALSETRVEIVPGGEKLVLAVAAAAADGPASGSTEWTAGADGPAGTAVSITVLGSKAL